MKIFLGILSVLVGFFVFLFVLLSYSSPLPHNFLRDTSQTNPDTELFFNPAIIPWSCYKKQSADIFINTGVNNVTSVQIEVSYDPSLFSAFTISPAVDNFFGEATQYKVSLLEVRDEFGRASLSMEILDGQKTKQGKGKLATIFFTTNPQNTSLATVTFLNKSTALGNKSRASLLKKTVSLTIQCE